MNNIYGQAQLLADKNALIIDQALTVKRLNAERKKINYVIDEMLDRYKDYASHGYSVTAQSTAEELEKLRKVTNP